MTTRARRWGTGMVTLALGLWFWTAADSGSAADAKGGLAIPEADFAKLVEATGKGIQEILNGKLDKKGKLKARTAAVMIAAYAQFTQGGDKAQRNALRDVALKLAAAIKDEKVDDAKKLVGMIVTGKPEGSSDLAPTDFAKEIDLDDVMRQFSLASAGGWGIESMLLKLSAKKKGLEPKDMSEQLAMTAYQVAAIGEMIKGHEPDKKPKDWQKQWTGFNEEMTKAALELASVVKQPKPDGKAALKVVNALNSSCNKCHEAFRDN
ncbi:MAG: cytochrome c [Gemmataceae bacterium]|nr:cytochrome c [Gemmataceae bacterium]MDW8264245.1 hypothetical protein [Gemmataceae bacterium]